MKTAIAQIVASILETDDWESADMKEVSGPPERVSGVHPDVISALENLGVNASRINFHYSDVYVMCSTYEEARQIANAGPWRSMAEVVRTNPDHPDAKRFPWLADLPFANMAGAMNKRLGQDSRP